MEDFDSSFELEKDADDILRTLLGSDIFAKQARMACAPKVSVSKQVVL